MKIENLEVGQGYKYKELCAKLGIEPKPSSNTNGRNAHRKEFKQYFEYEQKGQKYIITKIHKEKKKKEDKRENNKGGNNKVYQEDFEKLMICTLYNNNKNEMLLSKGAIFKVMNLCNDNYIIARSNIPKLSEILELPQKNIYEFYDTNGSKLTNIVERNLKAMRSKSLIISEQVVSVATYSTIIATNELNEPIIKNDKLIYDTKLIYREATTEEKEIILKYENEAKEELGATDNKEIFLKGKWKQYKKLVEQKLKDNNINIQFYYDAYKLTWDKSNIEKAYNQLELNCDLDSEANLKDNLNNNVMKSIEKSAKTRHTKSLNKSDKHDIDIFRSRDNYIEEQLKISDMLINNKANSLKEELKKDLKHIKITDKYEQKEDIAQLELNWDLDSLNSEVPF